jgi:hypothetical protein
MVNEFQARDPSGRPTPLCSLRDIQCPASIATRRFAAALSEFQVMGIPGGND